METHWAVVSSKPGAGKVLKRFATQAEAKAHVRGLSPSPKQSAPAHIKIVTKPGPLPKGRKK